MLFHGLAKLSRGLGNIPTRLATHGLPRWIAFGVYIGELIAPLMIVAGIGTRPAAAVVAFNMVVAVWLVHVGDLGRLSASGGSAVELQMLYLLGALAIVALGSGRIAVSRGKGRWD